MFCQGAYFPLTGFDMGKIMSRRWKGLKPTENNRRQVFDSLMAVADAHGLRFPNAYVYCGVLLLACFVYLNNPLHICVCVIYVQFSCSPGHDLWSPYWDLWL